MNKKGLEMRYILLLLVALLLIFFAIFWFTGLGEQMIEMVSNMFNIFG